MTMSDCSEHVSVYERDGLSHECSSSSMLPSYDKQSKAAAHFYEDDDKVMSVELRIEGQADSVGDVDAGCDRVAGQNRSYTYVSVEDKNSKSPRMMHHSRSCSDFGVNTSSAERSAELYHSRSWSDVSSYTPSVERNAQLHHSRSFSDFSTSTPSVDRSAQLHHNHSLSDVSTSTPSVERSAELHHSRSMSDIPTYERNDVKRHRYSTHSLPADIKPASNYGRSKFPRRRSSCVASFTIEQLIPTTVAEKAYEEDVREAYTKADSHSALCPQLLKVVPAVSLQDLSIT